MATKKQINAAEHQFKGLNAMLEQTMLTGYQRERIRAEFLLDMGFDYEDSS